MLAMVAANALALDTAALLDDPAMAALLSKKCICTEAYGVLPVRFDTAIGLLRRPDLIRRIQTECGFPITETGGRAYYYLNEKNQRTDIRELCRRQTSASTFDLVYYAAGKRFFGKYEVLIHIRAIDAGAAGTLYTATIHAYPHNPPLRFFARSFGTVDRYFQRETRIIARVATRLCEGMCEPASAYPTYSDPRIECWTGFL
jgi:hypothetical protein